VVRVVSHDRLYKLLPLQLGHTMRTALIHKRTELREGVSGSHLFVPDVAIQLSHLVGHVDDTTTGAHLKFNELTRSRLIGPPGEPLPV